MKTRFLNIFAWFSALKLIYSTGYAMSSRNCIPVFPQEMVQGSPRPSEPMLSSMFLREELEKVEGVPLDGMIPPSS